MQVNDYGMLNTQTDPRFGGRKYGRLGTIAKNGCGLIALYNVERAADAKTQFDPFYEARQSIKTNLFGLLGTRPSSVQKNLLAKGFSVARIQKTEAAEAEKHDAVIVLYWYRFGAHYVAGIIEPDGAYRLYNEFTEPYPMQLHDYLAFLKKHKKHVVHIWGVDFPKA